MGLLFIYFLFVDGMLVACKSKVEIDHLNLQLNQHFKMKDLGETKKILWMEITRDRVKGDSPYIESVFEENAWAFWHGLQLKTNEYSIGSKLQVEFFVVFDYRRGMWLHGLSSLVNAQATNMVGRYMHDPGKVHWQVAR